MTTVLLMEPRATLGGVAKPALRYSQAIDAPQEMALAA